MKLHDTAALLTMQAYSNGSLEPITPVEMVRPMARIGEVAAARLIENFSNRFSDDEISALEAIRQTYQSCAENASIYGPYQHTASIPLKQASLSP